jgi:nitroreductase
LRWGVSSFRRILRDISDAVNSLTASRHYSPEEVPLEIITEIVNAGRLAPSSRNSQPWRFLIIRDRERLHALSQIGMFATHLREASFCIAILTPDPEKNISIMFDAGQAAALMQLAALEHGVVSCPIKLHQGYLGAGILGYPEEYRLNYVLSFGYPQKGKGLKPVKKIRKPFSELVFLETWGESLG